MGTFVAASHHEVLILLIQIALLLAAARLGGELALRIGQPSVVGEITAGILLGPSFLSGAFPVLSPYIVPDTAVQGYLLEVVSMIGAMFLLLITGLETDVKLIKRHLRTAAGVSFGGIVTTFGTGFALGMYLPDKLLANPDQRIVFALFVATAMSISAIPVIAKVLMDLNLMRRDVGQTILAAGMSDDTNGWILLSIVAALATGGALGFAEVGWAVGKVLIFLLLSFTLGRVMIRKAFAYTQDQIQSRDRLLTMIVVFTFAFGAFTQALGLEAVLGAFVVGIILSQIRRLPIEVTHQLESIALGVFAPIFFAVAGLKVDIKGLIDPELAWFAFLVILVACGGKVIGTYLGARLIGKKDHWTALSFGAGLNARGAMEIIIATIGLSLGILSQQMFSIIVVMAMVTSLMAPTALRYTLSKVVPSEEELARLEREERAARSPLAGLHRILVPVRVRDESNLGGRQQLEGRVYSMLSHSEELSLTVMTIVSAQEKAAAQKYLDGLAPLFIGGELTKKVLIDASPVEAILEETKKDYQLLMLGATEPSDDHDDSLFSPAIDELVRLAHCPTLIFQATEISDEPFRRILVPTNGSGASRRAAELAFKLAADGSIHIEFLQVVVRDKGYSVTGGMTVQLEAELGRAHSIVAELVQAGETLGLACSGEVREAETVSAGVAKVVENNGTDLLILGTDIRPGGDRLFLGPEVERILRGTACPVIVMNR